MGAAILGLLSVVGFCVWIHSHYAAEIYNNPVAVPQTEVPRVAIVFGAGVWRDSRPSPILFDRIQTAAELYKAGRVRKLLMSGDNRVSNYNEPAVMRETALAMNVPDNDIILDYAGRRTFDTCYRAKEIFEVQNAILVTQAFHMDRAMYLCTSMGIESIGVTADRQTYSAGTNNWQSSREIVASLGAWLDLHILRPTPVLGDKLPIDLSGNPPAVKH